MLAKCVFEVHVNNLLRGILGLKRVVCVTSVKHHFKRAISYAYLIARLIFKTVPTNHDWTMSKVARNMFLVARQLIKPSYICGICELLASSCVIEYSISASNGECKRTFDISLPRIDAHGLKLPLSLANMKHCSCSATSF